MYRILVLVYGVVSYVVFFLTFLYAIGFVGNIYVSKTIDSGVAGPFWQALLVNVLLLGIFAIQHSVMARPGFKAWWTKIIPASIERSTYVLLTNGALILMYWKWQPMTDVVWNVDGGAFGTVLIVLFWFGWALVLLSTFMINHFDLFGLRQVYLNLKRKPYTDLKFTTAFAYKFIRHPLLLGFIIAFWAAPVMTTGHLLFAAVTTVYMLIAIRLEEKDMVDAFGETYQMYRREVPMLIPTGRRSSSSE